MTIKKIFLFRSPKKSFEGFGTCVYDTLHADCPRGLYIDVAVVYEYWILR